MTEWKTIDTAPRDGRWILLLSSRNIAIQSRWGKIGGVNGYESWTPTGKGKSIIKATHWCELPPLPKETENE